jgi:hypothetical protein
MGRGTDRRLRATIVPLLSGLARRGPQADRNNSDEAPGSALVADRDMWRPTPCPAASAAALRGGRRQCNALRDGDVKTATRRVSWRLDADRSCASPTSLIVAVKMAGDVVTAASRQRRLLFGLKSLNGGSTVTCTAQDEARGACCCAGPGGPGGSGRSSGLPDELTRTQL